MSEKEEDRRKSDLYFHFLLLQLVNSDLNVTSSWGQHVNSTHTRPNSRHTVLSDVCGGGASGLKWGGLKQGEEGLTPCFQDQRADDAPIQLSYTYKSVCGKENNSIPTFKVKKSQDSALLNIYKPAYNVQQQTVGENGRNLHQSGFDGGNN